jgi:hypothetical protein
LGAVPGGEITNANWARDLTLLLTIASSTSPVLSRALAAWWLSACVVHTSAVRWLLWDLQPCLDYTKWLLQRKIPSCRISSTSWNSKVVCWKNYVWPGSYKGHAGDLEKQAAQRHGLNFNLRMCSSGVGCVTTWFGSGRERSSHVTCCLGATWHISPWHRLPFLRV